MTTVLSLFGVIPNKFGSQEAYARELSLQLQERGWRSVLCFEALPPETVARQFELANVCLEVLDKPEELRWEAAKRFAAMVRRHQPDIVHLHYVGFIGFYPILARLLSAKAVYFTDHSSRPAGHVLRRAPLWKRAAARIVNAPLSGVVCVSHYGFRCMTVLGLLPPDRFHVVYNGVAAIAGTGEAERGRRFRDRYGIPEGRAIVTQASWIIPEKGIGDLIQACALVLRENPQVHLVLVGDGPARDDHARLASRLGIEDHVTWTGLVGNPFEEGVFAAADVVCQVSRWEEIFGFTIAEAMVSGKPVVATRVGGIPELIEDGETGFLVARGDTAQIADRILKLLASTDLRRRLGEAGRRVAHAKFDLKKNVAQLLQLYGVS